MKRRTRTTKTVSISGQTRTVARPETANLNDIGAFANLIASLVIVIVVVIVFVIVLKSVFFCRLPAMKSGMVIQAANNELRV